MKRETYNRLWFAFQNALLFNVTFHTRLVFVDVVDDKKVIMWVYLDREPTEDEKDVYYSVSAEALGKFDDFDDANSKVLFSTGGFSDEELRGKLVLFARCDYLDLEGNLLKSFGDE